jgi:hypothetical protein
MLAERAHRGTPVFRPNHTIGGMLAFTVQQSAFGTWQSALARRANCQLPNAEC